MAATLTLVTDERPPIHPPPPPPHVIKRIGEVRDASAFLAWVEQRIAEHEATAQRHARERGEDPPKDTRALRALLNEIGWSSEASRTRLQAWRRHEIGLGAHVDEQTGTFIASAELIDGALEHAGLAVWELYPDAGEPPADTREAFCPTCSDEVTIINGVCPWCESAIERPHTTARGGPPKHRRPPRCQSRPRKHTPASLDGLDPSPRLDPLAILSVPGEPRERRSVDELRCGMPEEFVRDAMRLYLDRTQQMNEVARILLKEHPGRWAHELSLRLTLRAAFRRRGVSPHLGGRRPDAEYLARERDLITAYLAARDPGYAYRGSLPAEIVWEAAYRYYLDGWGFRRIARHLLARSPWIDTANVLALSKCLFVVWRTNGWPTRPQRAASIAAGWRHGMTIHRKERAYTRHQYRQQHGGLRPRCDSIAKATGQQCCNFALREDTKCFAHSEHKREERKRNSTIAHTATRRELVESGPFVAWVRGRVSEYGSIRATAAVLNMDKALLSRILRVGGTSVPGKLTRRVIENALTAALENDQHLLVPRFSDLYDTTPPATVQLRPGDADQPPHALAA